jgi:folate-dependent phosphoribosylglycinamide formyltransferase PurN
MPILDHNWVAFFSQTGTEISNIMLRLGKEPVAIITNRQDDEGLNPILKQKKDNGLKWIVLPKNPTLKDYRKALKGIEDPIITLHGFLRIIPKEICNKYTIFNLHPGLITIYPELKGKDPQKRAIEAGHQIAGAVIHQVTPIVDDGEIVASHAINIKNLNEEEVYDHLHCLGSVMWYDFFNKHDCEPKKSGSKKRKKSLE